MSKYYPPSFEQSQFHCTHCGVYAKQLWASLQISTSTRFLPTRFKCSECTHCNERCFWYQGRMIVPSDATVPPPHVDMPEVCVEDYQEARDIVARSPRAAAALLRLTIQKLLKELGEKGNNINDDIGALVAKGLPVEVQQALDFCRVVGNNSVHPGEIEVNNEPEISHSLFEMINFIIEVRISQPKKVADLYNILPKGALAAVEKRDGVENT